MKSAPVFLTIAALLLAQLAIPFDLQFVQGRNVVSPVMLVFGGLALGQLLFLWAAHEGRRAAELSHPYYQILFLGALFLSLGWLPALAPLAATLVFLCFGASVSRLYRAHDLTRTVRASALAGVAAAAAFPLTSMVDTVHLKTAVLALLAAAGAFERAPRLLAIAALAAVAAFPFAGRPLFPGALRRSPATADYAYRGPTYFAPLLRTDIYDEPSTGNVVAVTNGIHFARVAGPRDPEPESPVLKRRGRALMIGSAAGRSLRKMLAGGFTAVDAVDINPNAFRASLDLEGARSSYGDPRVRRIVAEGRHFLHRPGPRYDLVYLEKVKLGEPVGGLSPHFEDFLYTQEALEQMWARLSDGGAILIVENLEDRAYSLTGGGLIDELARAARCSPKMAGAHILPLEGRWRRARMRGLLAVSKTPLSAADLDASELIADVEARAPRDPSCDRVLTDERPFHSNPRGQMPYYRWALAISLLPLAPMLYRRRRAGAGAADALSFASGMVYILWLAGVSGLFFMFFENPALIPPLVLFASFLTGLLCFHLPSRRRYLRAAAALILIAAPLIAALAQNKNHFLAQEGWLAPFLVLSLFAPGFVLVETPYMTVLRRSGSAVRVLAFENWGCLVAIPLCFLIKAHLGFLQMALAALGAAALLCLVLAGLRPKSSD